MIAESNLLASIRKKSYRLVTYLESSYQLLNRWTHGGMDDLKSSYHHYLDVHGKEGAATIAFFTIFALPPLIIVVITMGSFFLETEEIHTIILNFLEGYLPIPPRTALIFLEDLFTQRAALGIIGILGLLWSGSGALNALTISIDRAFPDTKRRNIIQSRLISFLMIGLLGLLLIITSMLTTIFHIIYQIDIPFINIDPSLRIFPSLIVFIFRFFLLMGLYYWIPNTKVRRRAAFWGALVASIAMEIISRGFTWYLQMGLDFYNFLYGSLGTLVALMLWIYINAQIIVISAHLTASFNQHINARSTSMISKGSGTQK